MNLKLASAESLYIEANGYTVYVDLSIPSEPPIVEYWEPDSLEKTVYECEWVAYA
jgi:hypothetical protein